MTTMLSTASNSVSSRPKRTAKKRKQVFGDENAVRANGRAFGPPPKRRKKQVRLSTDVEVFDIPPCQPETLPETTATPINAKRTAKEAPMTVFRPFMKKHSNDDSCAVVKQGRVKFKSIPDAGSQRQRYLQLKQVTHQTLENVINAMLVGKESFEQKKDIVGKFAIPFFESDSPKKGKRKH